MEAKSRQQPQKGKLIVEHGRFFLEAGGMRQELPAELLTDKEQLEKSAGRELEIIYSEPQRFVVGLKPAEPLAGRPWTILCYVPLPDWFRQLSVVIQPEARQMLAKQLLDSGVITQNVYEQLTGRG